MARTALVAVPPAALVALAWLRLEGPRAGGLEWAWVVLLALAPALAPALWLRLALVPPAALTMLWVAFDTPAPDDRPGFFAPVYHRFEDGVLDYYDVTLPFAAPEQPHMHGVLLVAVFAFCAVLAQAVAARRPLAAVLAVVAGAGWPSVLYPERSLLLGTLILAAALLVLAGLRAARPVPALVAGAAVVLLAAGASTSAAVAKGGVLDWEQWDPNGPLRVPVSVSYVWDANYGGIEFPEKATPVLRILGPDRGHYWRATTLDDFDGQRWLESPVPLSVGSAGGRLPPDPLLPEAAANPRTWVRQDVEILALRESRIVGAAQPVRLEGEALGDVVFLSGGLARVEGLERGQTYRIWSYAPRPRAAELARLEADYPPELERFLDLGRTRVEPFGTPGRDERVGALFEDERYLALWPYREVWEQARRLRADARTPYGAVVAIETWLRSTGGFRYDERPPRVGGLPPLAEFVVDGRRGYCQQFAGAMALMLRMLGVPARVAGGFTSGKREDGGWTVTDHNAHAWVEAWFPEYGWLPFDPTPGRGTLAASYSASSTGFNVGDAAEAFGGGAGARATGGGGVDQLRLLEREQLLAQREARTARAEEERSGIWLVLLLAGGAVAAIAVAKGARRRARYVTRDPRRVAAAARAELVGFLADQGVEIAPSTTPDELRERVRRELGRDAGPFARALAEARFGPPSATAEAAARARDELRPLLRALRQTLGRGARLRGFLALRSLRV